MGWFGKVKRVLVGKPIHAKHAHHERLPIGFALPVFASDALSSVAYATEQIMLVLVIAGTASFSLTLPISFAIALLLVIVVSSYVQTINAYPQGGGSYRVSTDNLGSIPGRIAGAALLIDYVLTVAVSVAAGVAAMISMAPGLYPYMVDLGVLAVAIVGLVNLRGAKESGVAFAVPTYSFITCVVVLVGGAIWKALAGGPVLAQNAVVDQATLKATGAMSLLLILRAFSAGCTALTGVEAIADGVQAFRPPEAKNATRTLLLMGAILLLMFLGTSWVAQHYQPYITPMAESQSGYKTILAQIALLIYGKGWFFYTLQIATALILVLAANTAFADFPRLSSFIARDGYLPRQLASVGDRLVFQNGIVLLSILAIALVVAFEGETARLIPLYAVGVFTSFTLSQAGMAARLYRERSWKMVVSGVGCLVTAIVTGIILYTKFAEGAWLIVVALGVLLLTFWGIKRHYTYLARELSLEPGDSLEPLTGTTALLLVPRMHKGILHAISYAQSTTKDVRALHVSLDKSLAQQMKADWAAFGVDMPLVILDSPYRSLVQPVIDYIDQTISENPEAMITVIVPQAVPKYPWQALLHTNAAVPLKMALKSRRNVVITNVRYFLK